MTGRVALVTGAARGQGAAIVAQLVDDGFHVAACDVLFNWHPADCGHADDAILRLPLDVSCPDQWRAAVDTVNDRLGTVSALINNAGVLHRASLADETPAGFERAWRVNCLGAFFGIRATLGDLRRAESAAIVNTCSTGAIRPFARHSAYGSSKWALRGLTQTAAAELAPVGIRVNAVMPGPIDTPMLDPYTQAHLAATAPSGRIGTPSEVAAAVAFLVSEQASFITGSELVVDGGQILQIG